MLTDQLWGGTLEALNLDASSHTASLTITVSHGDTARSFDLRLSGVTEFRFFNSANEAWDFAEFTEIRIGGDRLSGDWTFDIVLWSEDAGIVGRCRSISLNGAELEKT